MMYAICHTNEFGTGSFNICWLLIRSNTSTTSGETFYGWYRNQAVLEMQFASDRQRRIHSSLLVLLFNFQQVGTNCGLSPIAIDYDGVSYWMGDNTYAFDGRVNLPCTIVDFF